MTQIEEKIQPKIIALCGKAYSGKSTSSLLISEIYGKHNVEVFSFASPLKNMVRDVFMLSEEEVRGNKKDEINELWGVTPRKLLQVIGTELFRDTLPKALPNLKMINNSTLWTTVMYHKLKSRMNENKIILIDDLRFEDECKMIKMFPSLVIQVKRPLTEILESSHSSENIDLSRYVNIVIDNDGDMKELKKKLRDTLQPIFGEGYVDGYEPPINSFPLFLK